MHNFLSATAKFHGRRSHMSGDIWLKDGSLRHLLGGKTTFLVVSSARVFSKFFFLSFLKSCLFLFSLADWWLPVCCVDGCPDCAASQDGGKTSSMPDMCMSNKCMRLRIMRNPRNPLYLMDIGSITILKLIIPLWGTLQPPGAVRITRRMSSVFLPSHLPSGNRATATVWVAHGISPALKTHSLTWHSTKARNRRPHQGHSTTETPRHQMFK